MIAEHKADTSTPVGNGFSRFFLSPPLSFLASDRCAMMVKAAGWVLIPLGCSLLLTASFPPYDYGFLAWAALAPVLYLLRQTTCRGAMALAGLFGGLFGVEAFLWFPQLEMVSLWSFFLLAAGFIGYFVLFGWVYARIHGSFPAWLILVAPAMWTAVEYARANLGFLSLPWNLLGHSQYRYLPVIQIASLVGVYGLSFLVMLVNQVLSQIPDWVAAFRQGTLPTRNPGRPPEVKNGTGLIIPLGIGLLLLSLTLVYGWCVLDRMEPDGTIRVGLVQANVLTRDGMTPRDQWSHLQAYLPLTEEAAVSHPDLIVWPASSLPGSIQYNRLVRLTMRRVAESSGAHLLVGGAGVEKMRPKTDEFLNYSNSEFLISPAGKVLQQYNKMQLLAFNEYLPFQGYVRWPDWVTSLQFSFKPGTELTIFDVDGNRFGAPICWENMFADHFRRFVKAGARFMVSATNEGFFGISPAPHQTFASAVFRAVENRRAVVRAATTGISGFISPTGEIQEVIKDLKGQRLFVSGFSVRDVPLVTERTFYTRYGDIFAYLAIGLVTWFVIGDTVFRRLQERRC